MEEEREVFQFQGQLVSSQDLQLRLNGINKILLKLPLTMEERREVFQFQEPSLVLFQVLLLRPNGTKPKWLPLLEERREVFQFQEQLALFQDQLLRLNGINKTLLKLPLIMEERREVFQFQEQSLV